MSIAQYRDTNCSDQCGYFSVQPHANNHELLLSEFRQYAIMQTLDSIGGEIS